MTIMKAEQAEQFLDKSKKVEYGLRLYQEISINHVICDDGIVFRSENDPSFEVYSSTEELCYKMT